MIIPPLILNSKAILTNPPLTFEWRVNFFGKPLDLLPATKYNVARNKEVSKVSPESRAEYFKERRAKFKSFTVEVEREKMEKFEKKLSEIQTTKAEWLNRKIDEELGK